MLLFNIGVSVLTGILFGLAPALSASRTDLVVALRQGAAGSCRWFSKRARNALVAAEVAVTLVLLVGAGLLIRSFTTLQAVPAGFDPQNVLTARLSLPAKYREVEKGIPFFDQTLTRVRQLPGVESASMVIFLPMTGMVSGTGYWVRRASGTSRPGRCRLPRSLRSSRTSSEPCASRFDRDGCSMDATASSRSASSSSTRLSRAKRSPTAMLSVSASSSGWVTLLPAKSSASSAISGIPLLTEPIQPTVYYAHTHLYFAFRAPCRPDVGST